MINLNTLNFLLDSAVIGLPIIIGFLSMLTVFHIFNRSRIFSTVTGIISAWVSYGIFWYMYNTPLDSLFNLPDGYVLYWSFIGIIACGITWYLLYRILRALEER